MLLLLLHHHRHPLLPEVMTQQLSAALGGHLGAKETLLTPKKERNYTRVARASQFHTYSAPMTREVSERKNTQCLSI